MRALLKSRLSSPPFYAALILSGWVPLVIHVISVFESGVENRFLGSITFFPGISLFYHTIAFLLPVCTTYIGYLKLKRFVSLKKSGMQGFIKVDDDDLIGIYKTLSQNLPMKIFIKDANSVYLYCNDRYAKDLTISAHEITGKTDYDLFPKEVADKYREDDGRIALSGKTEDSEEKIIVDGRETWIHAAKIPVRNEKGEVIQIIGAFSDITQRKNIEDHLRKFALATATSPDPIIMTDMDGTITYCNEAACNLYKYGMKELIGHHVEMIDEDPARRREVIIPSLEENGTWSGEAVGKRRDGSHVQELLSATVVKDEIGNPVAMMSIVRDITESTTLIEDLVQSEERFRTIFDNVSDGMLIADTKTKRFLMGNRAIQEMLGYSDDEITGLGIEDVHPVDELPDIAEQFERLARYELGIAKEIPVKRRDGSVFAADVGAATAICNDRELLIGIFRDVTDRLAAERELQIRGKAMDTSLSAIAISDPEGNHTYVNDAFVKLWGFESKEEVMRTHPHEVTRSSETVAQHFEEISVKGSFSGIETFVRRDGSCIDLYLSAHKVTDHNGIHACTMVSFIDLTDQRKAERSLRREFEINTALAELSKELISSAPIDDISHFVLERAKFLTGSKFGYVSYIDPSTGHFVGSAVSREILKTCKVDDNDPVFKDIEGLWGWTLRNKKPVIVNDPASDYRSTGTPEGHVRIDRFISAPAMIRETLVGQIALANAEKEYTEDDLTIIERLTALYALSLERRMTEELLKKERDRVKHYLTIAGVIMVALDREGNVSMINQKGSDILGCGVEETIGKNWFDHFIPAYMRDSVREEFRRLMNGEIELLEYYENPILTGEGEERLISWRNSVVRNSEGRIISTLASGEDITDRRKAEERYTAFVHNFQGIAFQTDLQFRPILFHGAVEEITGYTERDFHERSPLWEEIILNEDRPKIAHDMEVIKTVPHSKAEIQHRIIRKDGGIRWVREYIRNICDDSGRVTALQGAIYDITKTKVTEENLVLLSKAIESLDVGVTITDIQGTIMYVNKAEAEMHGYTVDELIGNNVRMLAPKELHKERNLEPAMAVSFGSRESRNIRKSGDAFPVRLTAVNVLDDNEQTIGVVTVCEDITESKRAQEALRESEERYRSFVQNFQGIAFRGHAGFKPLFFHGAVETITGYTEEEFLGGSPRWDMIIYPDDLEKIRESVEKTDSIPGYVCDREYRIIRKDGEIRWIREVVQNISRSADSTQYVQGSIYDITERVALQDEAVRKAKLASIGELAASVAHEINNPLNVIINYAELLSLDLGGRLKDAAVNIIKEGERIGNIVSKLLSFTRNDREVREPVKMSDLVSEVLALTERLLSKSGIRLCCRVRQDLPFIYVSRMEIEQVILNIVHNARHALDEKYHENDTEKTLVINARSLKGDSGNIVRLVIYDRGEGIEEQLIDKVLQPFVTTKGNGKGTGLGLSISNKIIESHGGRFTINSRKDKFTKVTIDIPAMEGQ